MLSILYIILLLLLMIFLPVIVCFGLTVAGIVLMCILGAIDYVVSFFRDGNVGDVGTAVILIAIIVVAILVVAL